MIVYGYTDFDSLYYFRLNYAGFYLADSQVIS
jgi:hypothetical protein